MVSSDLPRTRKLGRARSDRGGKNDHVILSSRDGITLRRLYDIWLIIERVIGDLFQRVLDEIRVVAVSHVQHRVVPRVWRGDYRLLHVGFDVHRRRGTAASIHHQHHRKHRHPEGDQAADQQQN